MRSIHWTNLGGVVALGLCLGCSGSDSKTSDDESIEELDDVEVPTQEAAATLASSQINDSNFDEEYEKLLKDIEADEAAGGK